MRFEVTDHRFAILLCSERDRGHDQYEQQNDESPSVHEESPFIFLRVFT